MRSLNYGGAERRVVELAKALQGRGHDVTVVVFYREGPFLAVLNRAGVPVVSLEKRNRWEVVGFIWRLVRVLRRLRPEVVYAWLVEPSNLLVLVKPFLRRTRIAWAIGASEVDYSVYDWPTRASFRLSTWLARFADVIIANAHSGAKYHIGQGYPADRMVVIPNGFDVERFRPDPRRRRDVRTIWGIPDNAKVIGVVGRLDPMKDYKSLLEAVALLLRRRITFSVVVVGTGSPAYLVDLQSTAASLGVSDHIKWIGAQDDMAKVYNGFDVLCVSSAFGEGLSNALGEAMACGVPCVATDVGDARTILKGCGIVVPPRDAVALAGGIEQILSANDPTLGPRCRERIVRDFSIERVTSETEYRLFVGSNARP